MKEIKRFDGLRIPSYALPYLVNGDYSGLDDGDIQAIDKYMSGFYAMVKDGESLIFSPMGDFEEYFTWHPAFGLACNVTDCVILILG